MEHGEVSGMATAAPRPVVEVRYDHVTGERFRHGTKLVRWRPDKAPTQCTFEQLPRAETHLELP